MKFELEQKVRVKATRREGEVKTYKIEGYILDGKKTEVIQYGVDFGRNYNEWVKEELLEAHMTYDFSNKFELGLCDFLINLYLDNKKLDLVKQLHNEKQLYMR